MTNTGNYSAIRGCVALVYLAFGAGCATTKQASDLRKNVFDVQTRVLALERTISLATNQAVPIDKRMAAISADFEQIQQQLQVIQGKINTLEVALPMGHMPGKTPDEDSLAGRLQSLENRLAEAEETQRQMLELLTKKKSSSSDIPAAESRLQNLTDMERAFSRRRYKEVASQGELLLAKEKGGNKSRLLFLVAESLFKLGQVSKAALKFHEYLDTKPDLEVAHTKMRLGDAYRHLGDRDTAAIYYNELLDQYPSSNEADSAKRKLAKMQNGATKKKGA